jgi:cadmium resistance protein CadD (predicted permease)
LENSLSLIGVGIVAFASTNVDDLVMLVGVFAVGSYRPAHVVIGQFIGIAGLIALSLLGALIALIVPPAYIGFVGIVPIAIGMRRLWRRGVDSPGAGVPVRRASSLVTVTLLTLANGGDNLSLYVPLFSIHNAAEIAVLVAVFFAMTALWCAAGYALVRPRLVAVTAQRWGNAVLPFVMIGLGVYILVKTDALSAFAG